MALNARRASNSGTIDEYFGKVADGWPVLGLDAAGDTYTRMSDTADADGAFPVLGIYVWSGAYWGVY